MIVDELCQTFLETRPEASVRAMERMGPAQAAELLVRLPHRVASNTMASMHPEFAVSVLGKVPDDIQPEIISHLEPQIAAGLLRRMGSESRKKLIELLPNKAKTPLERLLRYPVDSVGATMDPSYPCLTEDTTLAEALESVRSIRKRKTFFLFVINRTHKLTGVVSVLELLSAEPDVKVGEVKSNCEIRLSAPTELDAVSPSRELLNWSALPVVDEKGVYLGALRKTTLLKDEDMSETNLESAAGAALGELYLLGWRGLASSISPQDPK